MPKLIVVDEPQSGDPHPFDYYYRPGMDLRPIPEGKNEFGWIWSHCRHYLFDPWFDVEDEVTPPLRLACLTITCGRATS